MIVDFSVPVLNGEPYIYTLLDMLVLVDG